MRGKDSSATGEWILHFLKRSVFWFRFIVRHRFHGLNIPFWATRKGPFSSQGGAPLVQSNGTHLKSHRVGRSDILGWPGAPCIVYLPRGWFLGQMFIFQGGSVEQGMKIAPDISGISRHHHVFTKAAEPAASTAGYAAPAPAAVPSAPPWEHLLLPVCGHGRCETVLIWKAHRFNSPVGGCFSWFLTEFHSLVGGMWLYLFFGIGLRIQGPTRRQDCTATVCWPSLTSPIRSKSFVCQISLEQG